MRSIPAILLVCCIRTLLADELPATVQWRDALELTVEGRPVPEAKGFRRVPDDAPLPDDLTIPVRDRPLAKHWFRLMTANSAGYAVRFVSDSPTLYARWTVTAEKLAMHHMTAMGVSGLDLYARDEKGKWRWAGYGPPTEKTNAVALASGLKAGEREYLLYLPLYNGTEKLEIGVEQNTKLVPAPLRDEKHARPILFYGTSITQGACASRPGMCHVALLGRWFDRPVINLGLSGHGKMDAELVELMTKIDPAVYVVDCLPNMNAEQVRARTGPLVKTLRAARPNTPILLVEDHNYADGWIVESRAQQNRDNQAALKAEYRKLKSEGVRNLHYLDCKELLGDDGEDTVDGTHATDLGFYRKALAFRKALKGLLPE